MPSSQVAYATSYGVMKTGRTTFYGGAPDHMNPNTASFGTLDGSCGCAHSLRPPLRSCFRASFQSDAPNYIFHSSSGYGACLC